MNQAIPIEDIEQTPVEQIAVEVAAILAHRMAEKDIVRLLQIVFLDVEEAAELLRVKPKTISTWICQRRIPVRYAGGKPLFLLSELLDWTLPDDDRHSPYRLSSTASCNMAANRLAAMRERKS